MKEKIWRKDGNKQIINSGWKLFDKQTNVITTGNAICNTQISFYIRPYNECECNGKNDYAKGSLMGYDLRTFQRFQIPRRIEDALRNKNRKESWVLYMFFTRDKEGIVRPFCWVITDYHDKLIDYQIVVRYGEQYMKRHVAALEAISYITE